MLLKIDNEPGVVRQEDIFDIVDQQHSRSAFFVQLVKMQSRIEGEQAYVGASISCEERK